MRYGQSVRDWPAFPDTPGALPYLKQHYKLVILSNVDNENFSFSNQKLGVEFDAIYTAEDIGSYKPSLRNFEYMLAKLGERWASRRTPILHTAESMFHDHKPANDVGPEVVLDLPPARRRGVRRHHASGRHAAL